MAESYQKTLQKWMKTKHDMHFLHDCKTHNAYSKFVCFEKYQKQNNKRKKQLLQWKLEFNYQ